VFPEPAEWCDPECTVYKDLVSTKKEVVEAGWDEDAILITLGVELVSDALDQTQYTFDLRISIVHQQKPPGAKASAASNFNLVTLSYELSETVASRENVIRLRRARLDTHCPMDTKCEGVKRGKRYEEVKTATLTPEPRKRAVLLPASSPHIDEDRDPQTKGQPDSFWLFILL
jgi:hypothetical protein